MSIGPTLYPCTIDLDDGSFSASGAQVHLDYSQDTGTVARVRVHVIGAGNQIETAFDAEAVGYTKGHAPSLVAGRHQVHLADGRTAWILLEHGSGGCCGQARVLKNWRPGNPATSGWRP
jgi:hypothetical protein